MKTGWTIWIACYIHLLRTTAALEARCCPPGFRIAPNISCSDERNSARNSYLQQTERENVCIRGIANAEESSVTQNRSMAELPNCPAHSMMVFCNTTIADPLFRGTSSNSTEHLEDNMCVDETGGSRTILFCPCAKTACIRKCCARGEIFDVAGNICVINDSTPDWQPEQENPEYILLPEAFPANCEVPHLLKIPYDFKIHGRCFSDSRQFQQRNDFSFDRDGSVQVNKYTERLPQESYCGEHTMHENGAIIRNNLLICLPQVTSRPLKFDIYGILLIVGGCFLLLTVVVSCYLPELRGTLYHKVTICHNVALMIASFTWGATNLLPAIDYATCVALSLVIQLTFLASFFWMNVMCIDIALAFKNLRSVYGSALDKGWRDLVWYSLYAWGCPLLLTSITAVMELLPEIPAVVRPGFGCKNCGFNPESYAILIYFYGPMIFILIFNLILFIMTLLRIRTVEKQTAVLKTRGQLRKGVQKNPEIQKVILFGKMFVLMGLTWGTEVVGWLAGGPAFLWYLPDLINFLRAIFLCFLILGKRSIIAALRQKLRGVAEGREDIIDSRARRSKSSSEKMDLAEIERRGRILARQITQTFRMSRNSAETQM